MQQQMRDPAAGVPRELVSDLRVKLRQRPDSGPVAAYAPCLQVSISVSESDVA
jgi:hypothetical protein